MRPFLLGYEKEVFFLKKIHNSPYLTEYNGIVIFQAKLDSMIV
jgi:hypothetical protein